MDDDGDILRPKKKSKVSEEDASTEDLRLPPNKSLSEHCAGSHDIDFVNSLSDTNRHRFFFSTRKEIPEDFIKEKLDMFATEYDEKCFVVLQTLAKCFIGQMIEDTRKSLSFQSSDAIQRSDLVFRGLRRQRSAL